MTITTNLVVLKTALNSELKYKNKWTGSHSSNKMQEKSAWICCQRDSPNRMELSEKGLELSERQNKVFVAIIY